MAPSSLASSRKAGCWQCIWQPSEDHLHAGLFSEADLSATPYHASHMPNSWSQLAHGSSLPSPSCQAEVLPSRHRFKHLLPVAFRHRGHPHLKSLTRPPPIPPRGPNPPWSELRIDTAAAMRDRSPPNKQGSYRGAAHHHQNSEDDTFKKDTMLAALSPPAQKT